MLEELTPAYEQIAAAPEQRLFAKVSDGDMAALGIDGTTLRQARVLTSVEQLEVFAPFFPQDQREVLEYLAAGFTVEDVWRDVVAVNLSGAEAAGPVDTADYATAIRHTRTRIALVTDADELRDILDKPFAAWRVFLHPSQRKVAYRASYSGPAQVTGGPGTGKTVVALHRVSICCGHLRDGDRILLTTYTNALVARAAHRTGVARRGRVRAGPRGHHDRGRVRRTGRLRRANLPLRGGRGGGPLGAGVPRPPDFTGTAQFLAQEYKHVILAQNLRSLEEYEACERRGRGSCAPDGRRAPAGVATPCRSSPTRLAADGLRTYLGTCAEAADLLEATGRGTGTSSSTRPRTCTRRSGGCCAPRSPSGPTTCSSRATRTSASTTRRCR